MKVLFFADLSSIHARRWVESVRNRGIEVAVLSPTNVSIEGVKVFTYPKVDEARPSSKFPSLRSVVLAEKVIFSSLGLDRSLLNPLEFLRLGKRISPLFYLRVDRIDEVIREFNPDVIHVHYLSRLEELYYFSRIKDRRLIVSVWGDDIEEQIGPHLNLFRILRGRTLKNAASVSATSHFLARETESYSQDDLKVTTVPFGVDLNKFFPAKKSGSTIGFIKHFYPGYGIETLLEAASIAVKEDPELKFVLIGDGDQKPYQDISKRLGVAGNITFSGPLDHSKVPESMRSFGLFVMPSEHEVFGVSAVEAEASGLPVIATKVGGIPEIVIDGETGFLVKSGDSENLARRIVQVMTDNKLRLNLGKQARALVEKKYDWEKNVSEMISLYEDILKRKTKVCMAVTNPFTHDLRVYREAKTLVDAGYAVTVIALKDIGVDIPDEEDWDGIKVKRISKKAPVKSSGLKFIFEKIGDFIPITLYGSSFSQLLKLALDAEKADIYHAHDLDTLLPSYQAASENKSKIVYDSHEIFLEALKEWQDEFRSRREWLKLLGSYLAINSLSRVERRLINKVDKVITINNSIADYLRNYYQLKKLPSVIYNCSEFTPVTRSDMFRKEYQIPKSDKVVLYQGGFSPVRGLDKLILAMKEVRGAVLVMMGDGEIKDALIAEVKELGLEKKIFFHKTVPPKDLLSYTASADLGVIPYRKTSLNNYYCSPNKIFEYMMAGIPMVVSNFPVLTQFAFQGVGKTFDPESPPSIAAAINEVIGSGKIENMKRKARKLAEEKYNWKVESKKLLEVYSNLT